MMEGGTTESGRELRYRRFELEMLPFCDGHSGWHFYFRGMSAQYFRSWPMKRSAMSLRMLIGMVTIYIWLLI